MEKNLTVFTYMLGASLVAPMVKNDWMLKTQVQSLSWEDPLEKEMTAHYSILAWKISWTEEPGGLQSLGLQRVGYDSHFHFVYIYAYSWILQTISTMVKNMKRYAEGYCSTTFNSKMTDNNSDTCQQQTGWMKSGQMLYHVVIFLNFYILLWNDFR